MGKIKNIVFDFGGVIVDINQTAALNKFKEIGIDNIEELLDPYRQKGIFCKIEDGSISREDFYAEICRLTGKNIDSKDIDQGWLDFIIMPVEQAKLDYILKLRAKYKVLLLSNTNDIIMRWAMSEKFSPAGKPLDYYFDELYLSYKLGCMKPDFDIFQIMIEVSGINPAETLFIDDSEANITSGKTLGFKTVLFKKEDCFSDIEDKIAFYGEI
ncbi:MAG: HAD family phosphatase [Prevotellaceae bacterium]|jgi:putative hydrolase of the HAD superfamily|nr:HAD family phosphatase [Prevotellaceae bacterium]